MAMDGNGHEPHFETDAARGASSPNIVRWILIISLFGAIVLLSIIWITGAATQGERESKVQVDALGSERTAEGTDSIVGEDADRLETAPGAAGNTGNVANENSDTSPAASETD
jgi:hypothetical protein